MMDWNAVGVVAACAWCGILLAIGVWKIFGRNDQKGKCCQCENVANPNVANCQLGIGIGNIGNNGNIIPFASALKQKPFTTLVFLSFAAIATVEAQKQGQLRIENGELRMENEEGGPRPIAVAILNSQLSTLNSPRAATAILNSQLSILNSSRSASSARRSIVLECRHTSSRIEL